VFRDQFAVHARLAVVALERGQAGEPEQVPQAGGVAGHHRHVRVRARARDVAALTELVRTALRRLAPENGFLDVPAGRREIRFDTDDRFDTALRGAAVEFRRAVHVAMVGHRHRRHVEALGLAEQRIYFRCAVEHRILGVHMQVNK
jgi:hypothetical protein